MQDQPSPTEILGAVAAYLKHEVTAAITPHALFQAKVGGNALEIAQRDLELSPAADAAETARLERLLGRTGGLLDLNRDLARRIEAGEVDLSTPGLAGHLWATTLAKLAVDQPTYSGYLAAVAERSSEPGPSPS